MRGAFLSHFELHRLSLVNKKIPFITGFDDVGRMANFEKHINIESEVPG